MKRAKAPVAAAFIRDHAIELRKLALKAKLRLLAFLLEMVILEADAMSNRPDDRRSRR